MVDMSEVRVREGDGEQARNAALETITRTSAFSLQVSEQRNDMI